MENKLTSSSSEGWNCTNSDRPVEEYEKSYIVGSGYEPGGRRIPEIDKSRIDADGLTPKQRDIIEANKASTIDNF